MFNCGVHSVDSGILISKFNLNEIENWSEIDEYKRTFIISESPHIKCLRYPGFIFKNVNDAKIYFNDFYCDIYDVFTPPRGNLSENIVFMGIKPGSFQLQKLPNLEVVSECSWLLGPSSKRLNVALYKCGIYPYFTNVYHYHQHELNCDISLTLKEIETLFKIHKKIKFFFMGNYKEFDKIVWFLNKNDFDFEYHRIWHPSYILRNGDKNFDEWVEKIKEAL